MDRCLYKWKATKRVVRRINIERVAEIKINVSMENGTNIGNISTIKSTIKWNRYYVRGMCRGRIYMTHNIK